MGVERGDLVDLDKREAHLLGEGRQMARMEAAVMILQQMQMLDQQVAPPLALPEQRLDLVQSCGVDLPAFRMIEPAPPARARMDAAVVLCFQSRRAAISPSPAMREREGPIAQAMGG